MRRDQAALRLVEVTAAAPDEIADVFCWRRAPTFDLGADHLLGADAIAGQADPESRSAAVRASEAAGCFPDGPASQTAAEVALLPRPAFLPLPSRPGRRRHQCPIVALHGASRRGGHLWLFVAISAVGRCRPSSAPPPGPDQRSGITYGGSCRASGDPSRGRGRQRPPLPRTPTRSKTQPMMEEDSLRITYDGSYEHRVPEALRSQVRLIICVGCFVAGFRCRSRNDQKRPERARARRAPTGPASDKSPYRGSSVLVASLPISAAARGCSARSLSRKAFDAGDLLRALASP